MDTLAQRLNHTFRKPELLEEALTHPCLNRPKNNQRLEFLGDAVLGLIVSRILYELFPKESEGELARRQAALVCGPTLAQVAREIGIGEALLITSSEAAAG